MRAAALVALAMALPACGGGGVTPGGDAAVRCSSQADCDDGLFCNGVERCSPDDDAADSLGCVVSAGCPGCSTPSWNSRSTRRVTRP